MFNMFFSVSYIIALIVIYIIVHIVPSANSMQIAYYYLLHDNNKLFEYIMLTTKHQIRENMFMRARSQSFCIIMFENSYFNI